jgi:hypothetical protein
MPWVSKRTIFLFEVLFFGVQNVADIWYEAVCIFIAEEKFVSGILLAVLAKKSTTS